MDSEHQYWSVVSTDDGNVVHRTGDEYIGGEKYFYNTGGGLDEDGFISSLNIYSPDITKGEPPQTGTRNVQIGFLGNQLDFDWRTSLDNRLSFVRYVQDSTGVAALSLNCYDPNNKTQNTVVALVCGYDENGIGYGKAPSTKLERVHGNDILTRDWIPKDTRIVHNGGTEYIAGSKRFTSGGLNVVNTNASINVNPTADPMYWGFNFLDKDDNLSARILHYYNNDTGSRGLAFSLSKKAATTDLCSIITGLLTPSTNKYVVYAGNTGCTAFAPYVSGITLGENSTAHRWGQIYSSSTTIATSDERVKTSVESVPEKVLDAWENVSWIQFQMKDAVEEKGTSARIHNGLIAQQIDVVFSEFGLDASRYGLFCHDEWDAEETTYDDIGSVLTPGQEAGDLYSVRYEEALCMEAAYNRREVKRLKERLARLEEQLAK